MFVEQNLLEESFLTDVPLVQPGIAFFNLTKRCNAGCQYCSDWKNDPDPKTDDPTEKMLQLLDDLKSMGIRTIVFTGGEPYLRRDLYEILSYSVSLGINSRIITNGTALTEKAIYKTIDCKVSKIGVSLDSPDPKRFFQIRRLKADLVLKNIRTLSRIKQQEYPELETGIQVTVNRLNIKDLLPLAELAKELNTVLQLQPVHYSGTGLDDQILNSLWPSDKEIDELERVMAQLLKLQQQGYPIGRRPEYLYNIPKYFRDKTFYADRCYVAHTTIVIDQDLKMRPCWAMDPVADLSGSTRMQTVWASEQMREVRQQIREHKCPGCLYSCHNNPKYVPLPFIDTRAS